MNRDCGAKASTTTAAAGAFEQAADERLAPAPEYEDDWERLRGGDRIGLRIIFDRHKDYVFRLALGFLGQFHLAEDVTQEVFLRIARGRSRWRRQARFRTWLYQVTLNTARELRRKHPASDGACTADDAASPDSPQGQINLTIDLQQALAALPERQRAVILLRYYEGLSTAETAAILRCRAGTVKSHLHRATQTLQHLLSETVD